MAIGNKLVRKQRVVDSLFKRKKKSLGEAKQKYVSLSNYLERANDKLEGQDDIADKDLKKLKSGNFQVDNKGKGTAGNVLTAILGIGAIGAVDMVTQLASKGKKFAGNMFGRVKGLFVKEGAEKTAKVGTGTAVKASKTVTREGLEAAGKAVTKEGTEQLAKKGTAKLLAKKLPLVGLVLGTTFAIDRAAKGDMAGAAMEFLSGAASTVPGWGTAASVAIDAGLIAKDVKDAVDNEDKGETTTNANVSDQTSFSNVEPQSSMLELNKFDSAVDDFGKLLSENGEIRRTTNTTTSSDVTQVSNDSPPTDIPGSSGDSKSLADAAESLRGLNSNRAETDYGKNGCVWAVNQVYEQAGLTPPWGSSLWVPTAEQKMIDAGYTEVPINQRQAGDVMVMYDNHATDPQAHIGVVLENGNVLSNSSKNASLSWEASPEDYNAYYRNTGKIYRMPGATTVEPEKNTKNASTEISSTAKSVTTETPPTELAQLEPRENEIRKRVIPATSVRGKDRTVYERFDGEQWMQGTGETAKEYKYLFDQQEYLRSEQGQINNPNQGLMVNDRLVQPVRREETDTNLVSQYTSYNNPRTTLNSTTIVAMGGIPGSTKTPMVMQTGGSQTAIIPESANAMMMRLSQQMLFHKLTS